MNKIILSNKIKYINMNCRYILVLYYFYYLIKTINYFNI